MEAPVSGCLRQGMSCGTEPPNQCCTHRDVFGLGPGSGRVNPRRGTPWPGPSERSLLERPEHLQALLEESDAVVVCCQWTPETTKLIGREAFAAMKPGVILVNVARGKIIDEEAPLVAVDVSVGEFEHAPVRRSGTMRASSSPRISPAAVTAVSIGGSTSSATITWSA